MKRIILAVVFSAISTGWAFAADNGVVVTNGSGVTLKSKDVGAGVQSMQQIVSDTSGNPMGTLTNPFNVGTLNSPGITAPTSTLTLPATTTAYSANTLLCSSPTLGTCNTTLASTSFTISYSGGGAIIPQIGLTINDGTGTAWGAAVFQVDLWSAAPTMTNGDRGVFAVTTGSSTHLVSYTCTMEGEMGDGVYGMCTPKIGNINAIKLASGTTVYWTIYSVSGGGVTGASKVVTLRPIVLN